jgi:2-hydroxychromene-2-carboxylate isomerase
MLEFWFEFGSTYSYPAALRVERLARAAGVALAWKPFLLGPIFKAQGWNDSPFNLYEAKGRYMWRDLERLCAAEGLPFARPSRFPRSGLLAARVACRFAGEPWLPRSCARCTARTSRARRDLEPAVVARCLGSREPDRRALLVDQTAEAKARLRALTEGRSRRTSSAPRPSSLAASSSGATTGSTRLASLSEHG